MLFITEGQWGAGKMVNLDGWEELNVYADFKTGVFEYLAALPGELEEWSISELKRRPPGLYDDTDINFRWDDLGTVGGAPAGVGSGESNVTDKMRAVAFAGAMEEEPIVSDDVATSDSSTAPDVTVIGTRSAGTPGISWAGGGGSEVGPEPHPTLDPNGGGGPLPDEDEVVITINIANRTAEQNALIEDYKAAIDRTDRAVRSLADDARIRLHDGSVVTGRELKLWWSKTDFVINPTGTLYLNGTERGEADFGDGNPVVSMNIGTLNEYNAHSLIGLNYLVLHELGHFTEANRNFDGVSSNPQSLVERMANDIARAIANHGGIGVISNPGEGYSTTDPIVFS